MEVKSVYLNLKEGKKNWNVWMLEDEAFKDPIEIKICYDNHELKEFKGNCDYLAKWIQYQEEKNNRNSEKIWILEHWMSKINDRIDWEHEMLLDVSEKGRETRSELKELYKAISDAKNTIELQNWIILKLQEQVKKLEQKTSKQPMVFHDKCFISWRESSGLWMFELKDGDYLMVLNVKIWEHNEYVNNQDGLIIEKIHVEGQHYIPFYKLEWGTELDKPTATIYYDLVFMPL